MLVVDVVSGARHLHSPRHLAVQAVEFGNVAHARIALAVNLASRIYERHPIFLLAHNGGINIVVIVVIPHRLHIVEVDAEDIAVVVTEITIVFIHAHTRFHACGMNARTIVTQKTVLFHLTVFHIVFVNQAVFAGPKHKSIGIDGRRVAGWPKTRCLGVETGILVHDGVAEQIHHILAHRSVGLHAMSGIHQSVESWVNHGRAFHRIAHIYRLARCLSQLEVDEMQFSAKRCHHNLLLREIGVFLNIFATSSGHSTYRG